MVVDPDSVLLDREGSEARLSSSNESMVEEKIENKHDKRNNVVWERPAICVNIYTYIFFASHL